MATKRPNYAFIYLYGFWYDLVRAKAWRNIFHKMDTCILGYESECASNKPASKHRFSHNVDIFGLSCPLETCKSKHNNNFILALLATIWGQNCDRMQFWYAHFTIRFHLRKCMDYFIWLDMNGSNLAMAQFHKLISWYRLSYVKVWGNSTNSEGWYWV